jgi:hypothetical protein
MMRAAIVLGILTSAFAACGSSDDKLKVTNIDPDSGDVGGGQYVRIYGNGFTCDGNCVRNAKVYFGSRKGEVVRFASNTELIVQAPGGKPGEVVDILLRFEPGGEIAIRKAFTFKEPPLPPNLNNGPQQPAPKK